MSPVLREEDRNLASKIIDLLHDLEALATEERRVNNDAARNLADAARSLRQWLDDLGLGPYVEPLQ
jgi:hypothetical protein